MKHRFISIVLILVLSLSCGREAETKRLSAFCSEGRHSLCQRNFRYVIYLNEQECINCRQQFYGALKRINESNAGETLSVVFDDARELVARKVVREYLTDFPSIVPEIIIDDTLYGKLVLAGGSSRSNLIVLDTADHVVFRLMEAGKKELRVESLPVDF